VRGDFFFLFFSFSLAFLSHLPKVSCHFIFMLDVVIVLLVATNFVLDPFSNDFFQFHPSTLH